MNVTTVNQPTSSPTNKLSAATLAAAVMAVAGLMLRNFSPEWYDPDALLAFTPLLVYGLGYFVKDKPNTVVEIYHSEGGA